MARTFTGGQATDPNGNATTNAATIYANIKAALIANAAWTLVEELTPATGFTNGIFKCAASAAGMEKDFYLVIYLNAAQMRFYLGEDYSTSTHVLSNCLPSPTSVSGMTLTSEGLPATPSSFNASTNQSSGPNPNYTYTNISSTSYWAVIADVDGATFAIGTFAVYTGAFESLVQSPLTDPNPLCLVTLSDSNSAGSSSSVSGPTRMPGLTSITDNYQGGAFQFYGGLNNTNMIASGARFGWGTVDFWTGVNQAYQIALIGSSSLTYVVKYGYLRGLLKHHLTLYQGPSGGAPGDTVEIGGKQYVLMATGAAIACETGA